MAEPPPLPPPLDDDEAPSATGLELDIPRSPRGRGAKSGGAVDTSGVYVDDRDDAGRFLRVSRPVRRGEAILVEDPLFMSPADPQEVQQLLAEVCDMDAVVQRASASPPPTPGSSWLPLPEQLTLVVVQALVEAGDVEDANIDAFRDLRGDVERWSQQAGRLWSMLREEYRAQITQEAVCEVYAIVSSNSHAAEGARCAIFSVGSMAEHSCAPTAFKEVIVPMDCVSRPGSPCCESRETSSPPGSPCKSPFAGSPLHSMERLISVGAPPPRPQLVFRAQTDLAEDDIVSISYISEYLPTWKRKEQLSAGYGFDCVCPRCDRDGEAVCAFFCPSCGDGPCYPTHPVPVACDYMSQSFRCESCDSLTSDEGALAQFVAAENEEVVTQELMTVLHPYHWKVFGMYLHNLKDIPAVSRVEVVDQLLDAKLRLCKSDSHPLLGKLSEKAGNAHLENGDQYNAIASFKRAQELYAISHRGPPDAGHQARCYRDQARASAGRLGAAPRRLSRVPGAIARSPSLPSLAEGITEE